jgi:hypothetical protein
LFAFTDPLNTAVDPFTMTMPAPLLLIMVESTTSATEPSRIAMPTEPRPAKNLEL